MQASTLAFGWPGTTELIIIGVVALLIFGRRLPDVARSVGKSIVEFKRGMRDVKDEIDTTSRLDSKEAKALDNSPSPNGTSQTNAANQPAVDEKT